MKSLWQIGLLKWSLLHREELRRRNKMLPDQKWFGRFVREMQISCGGVLLREVKGMERYSPGFQSYEFCREEWLMCHPLFMYNYRHGTLWKSGEYIDFVFVYA
ncbi:MAG: hypothetical protein WC444_00160 [Candidatus Paceibacterota bacterium]